MKNLSKILILLITFVLFLNTAKALDSCTDSDGGNYPYIKGQASTNYGIYSDKCVIPNSIQDGNNVYAIKNGIYYGTTLNCETDNCYVAEAICTSEIIPATKMFDVVNCPNGCSDGACLMQEEPEVCNIQIYEESRTPGNSYVGDTVTLAWTYCPNTDIYRVEYRGGAFGTNWIILQDLPTNGLSVKVSAPENLDYRVTAIDDSGKIGTSNILNVNGYEPGTPSSECTDSDGGKNYYVKGTAYDPTESPVTSRTDYCDSTNTVVEYYCVDNCVEGCIFQNYAQCQNGCSDGACLGATTIQPLVCRNVDNAKFSGTISSGGGLWPGFDWSYSYGLFNYNNVWYDDNLLNENMKQLEIHYTGNVNHEVRYSKGDFTFDCDGVYKRVCISEFYIGQGDYTPPTLYVAQDGSTYHDASLSKLAVACTQAINLTATCVDTDGGQNYFTRGTTSGTASWTTDMPGNIVNIEDYCGNPTASPQNQFVTEFYCSNDLVMSESRSCLNGCSSGACLSETPINATFGYGISIDTDKYYYTANEQVKITATVQTQDPNLNLANSQINVGVCPPEGSACIVLPMTSVGGVASGCAVYENGTAPPCLSTYGWMFVGYYNSQNMPFTGLYTIRASATLDQLQASTNSKFEVSTEPIVGGVSISLEPSEQSTVVGQPVKYRVLLQDNHPVSDNDYRYLISVYGLPYQVETPSVINVKGGQSTAFTISVFPSSTATAENRATVVTQDITPVATPVAVTGYAVAEREITQVSTAYVGKESTEYAGAGSATAQRPEDTTPELEEGYFQFTVKATQENDYSNTNSAQGVLRVIYSVGPQPPPFPIDGEEVKITLRRGWNLINLPGSPLSITSNCPSDIYGFVYLVDEQRYVTLQEAEQMMDDVEFIKYLTVHAFWAYVTEECAIYETVSEFATYSGMQLSNGWNLVGVTKDMVGETLDSINNGCTFTKVYSWDAQTQTWQSASGGTLLTEPYNGLLIKTSGTCGFKTNKIMPPSFPVEVK